MTRMPNGPAGRSLSPPASIMAWSSGTAPAIYLPARETTALTKWTLTLTARAAHAPRHAKLIDRAGVGKGVWGACGLDGGRRAAKLGRVRSIAVTQSRTANITARRSLPG